MKRAKQTIYNVYKAFDKGLSALDYYKRYKNNKKNCGRRPISLFDNETEYIQKKVVQGWTPDVTIVGKDHKSAVITLVERLSKVIITLKTIGRRAIDIQNSLNNWFKKFPCHLFKSITFDCGKEFSNGKSISNLNHIDIYFAAPGPPSQRGLNENSNGLLRKDGLPKQMDFNKVEESFIQSIASKRNNIPRKSLNYKTPLEVFLSYVDNDILSSLI